MTAGNLTTTVTAVILMLELRRTLHQPYIDTYIEVLRSAQSIEYF